MSLRKPIRTPSGTFERPLLGARIAVLALSCLVSPSATPSFGEEPAVTEVPIVGFLPEAVVNEAKGFITSNRFEAGVAHYRDGLKNDQNAREATVVLITFAVLQGTHTQWAIEQLEALLPLEPEPTDLRLRILYALILAADSGGDSARVVRYAKECEDIFSDTRRIIDGYEILMKPIGLAYLGTGDNEKALNALQCALRENPKDAVVHACMGLVYKQAGLKATACDHFFTAGKLSLSDRQYALKCLDLMLNTDPTSHLARRLRELIYSNDNLTGRNGNRLSSSGTGWFVGEGKIVTCDHVIGDSTNILVESRIDGIQRMPARVLVRDRANDIVLLSVAQNLTWGSLPLSSSGPMLGEKVFTIGLPHSDLLGVAPKFTDGTVSSLSGYQDDPRVLQISVPVQSGNSGGPLCNMQGEVIGIVSHKLSAAKVFAWTGDLPQNVNYAIKADYLECLLPDIETTETDTHPKSEVEDLSTIVERVRRGIVLVTAR